MTHAVPFHTHGETGDVKMSVARRIAAMRVPAAVRVCCCERASCVGAAALKRAAVGPPAALSRWSELTQGCLLDVLGKSGMSRGPLTLARELRMCASLAISACPTSATELRAPFESIACVRAERLRVALCVLDLGAVAYVRYRSPKNAEEKHRLVHAVLRRNRWVPYTV